MTETRDVIHAALVGDDQQGAVLMRAAKDATLPLIGTDPDYSDAFFRALLERHNKARAALLERHND